MAPFTWCLALFLSFFRSTYALINPILPGWNPDPSIIRVGEDYFIATSTFEEFPGHPIYHSKDLVEWTLIGHGLNRQSQLTMLGTPNDAGIWAPSLRYHEGRYYLATTTRYVYTPELRLFPRSFYVWTDDIFSNNWSEPIYFDALGYDADLFWDSNGDVYNTWAGINNAIDKIYGIYQNKIDLATGDSLTPAELIFSGTLENNSSARPEGPHVYLINGTYYLMIAEGGTGVTHRATIQRGPSPSGPWENNPANPILYNGADRTLPVQNTGHADFVEAPDGSWWGVALGVRPQAQNTRHTQLGRETFLFPVHWEDGWPVFNNGEFISEHLPDVLYDRNPAPTVQFAFTESEELDESFFFHRTPYKPFHSLSSEYGLRLKGNSYALGDRDNPALVLRRQASYNDTFETELNFQPTNNLTEAGITIADGDLQHNEIGITSDPEGSGERYILTRIVSKRAQEGPWALTAANSTVVNTTYIPLQTQTEPVRLTIIGNSTSYTFGYAEGNATEFTFTATIDSSLISDSPAGGSGFKGASYGAYNTGNGRPTLVPADFTYWRQTGLGDW